MRRRGWAMTDLLLATQDAVFAALDVTPVTTLAPVFTSVPPNTQPPFVAVGLIDADLFGANKGSGVERHTVEIEFLFRGNTRRPLLAMMHAARVALESATLSAPAALLTDALWQASATDRENDGVTWHGIHRFELFAQAT